MKKWQLIGSTVIGASLLLGACSGSNGASKGSDVEGKVKGDGSSTVGPIIEKLNEKFAKDYPKVTVSNSTAGNGGGDGKKNPAAVVVYPRDCTRVNGCPVNKGYRCSSYGTR